MNTSLAIRPAAISKSTTTRRTENKPRRESTPEQKEAAAARRAALRGMFAKIKALPIEKRVLLADTYGIRSAEEGREFSVNNQLLIAFQLPSASVVGGFDQWRKVGRCVRKGSKALAIWIPIGTGRDRDGAPAENATATATDPDETRFILGNVFDISQTYDIALGDIDGPPALPAPAAPIIDNARLLEWGADPAALAAADADTGAPLALPAPAPPAPDADPARTWNESTTATRERFLTANDSRPGWSAYQWHSIPDDIRQMWTLRHMPGCIVNPGPAPEQTDDITLTEDMRQLLADNQPALLRELRETATDHESGPLYTTFYRVPLSVIRRVNHTLTDLLTA